MRLTIERCGNCGHSEQSDGYGGNDCPVCTDVKMKLVEASGLVADLYAILIDEESVINPSDAYSLACVIRQWLPRVYAEAHDLLEALKMAEGMLYYISDRVTNEGGLPAVHKHVNAVIAKATE